jgi:homoserine O-succinyltransferase
MLPEKLSGVYKHKVERKRSILFRGFDDEFLVPHSRYTGISREAVEADTRLKLISSSEKAGVYAIATENGKQVFITGHPEYDEFTLKKEYDRDVLAGINPNVPDNYFEDDDPTKPVIVRWRAHANLLYSNWLNYFVYQTTPYDIEEISKEGEEK